MSGTSLGAWMNGEFIGTWRVVRGVHSFIYDPAWARSPKVRPLSLSIPMTASQEVRGEAVAHYFDNLLPDNDRIRERLGRRFGTRGVDTFSLLQAIGRDCVGAVQLLPDGQAPQGWDRVEGDPLTTAQTAALLRAVPSDTRLGLPDDDDLFRISLAGAQEKTALLRVGDTWHRPHGATPTTHILKLPLGLIGGSRVDLSDSVQNEWLCAQIAEALGLEVARTEMARFDGQPVLVVERFDRAWMDDGRWIVRLPQEDFCQALGVPPSQKYEAGGGPGMARCLQLLSGGDAPAEDTRQFQLTQLAFWLMAATDGHAKNHSIFLGAGGGYEMTPLYDIISFWPYFGNAPNKVPRPRGKLAMALRSKNVHYELERIEARHWHRLAMKHGGEPVWQAMQAMVDAVEPALARVEAMLPADFPQATWQPISQGMVAEAARFRRGLADLGPDRLGDARALPVGAVRP